LSLTAAEHTYSKRVIWNWVRGWENSPRGHQSTNWIFKWY